MCYCDEVTIRFLKAVNDNFLKTEINKIHDSVLKSSLNAKSKRGIHPPNQFVVLVSFSCLNFEVELSFETQTLIRSIFGLLKHHKPNKKHSKVPTCSSPTTLAAPSVFPPSHFTCLAMSRAFSSKKPSSLPPPPTPTAAIATSRAKKKQSPRSPLQDLNRASSSSNSSYASSNVSIEPPRGCLRFLSSSSFKTPVNRPKNLTNTPNSVPDALVLKQSKSKSSKENLPKGNLRLQTKRLPSDKAPRTVRKNPPCLYQWQSGSGKKSGSRTSQKSKPCSAVNERGKVLPKLPSASEELKRKEDRLQETNDSSSGEHSLIKSCRSDATMTPLSKKVTGSDFDCTVYVDGEENLNKSISGTPPIHNSVSPEIQCGSSLVSTTTPACYGAGYVVSGVSDKRKCRPRGILTVEENYSGFDKMGARSFDDDTDEKKMPGVNNHASPSLLPSPTEALVLWLSSPRNKGKKVLSRKSEIGLSQCQGLAESTSLDSSASPTSSSKTFWNLSDSSGPSGAAYGVRRKMNSSISPNGLSECQAPFDSILSPYLSILLSPTSTLSCKPGSSEKEKNDQHNLIDGNSPFSLNSFGSGNVIQTPQSDSSSDLHIGLSLVHADNRKEDNCNPVPTLSEVLLSEDILLNSSAPLEDSVNSSFQFDCLTVPYESIDFRRLPKFSDDQDPWLSSSTIIDNASHSQMRISWREGLMSQYEEDEFDCCRCLSDEEDLANDCGNKRLSDPQVNVEVDGNEKFNSDARITETEDNELRIDGPVKEMFPALVSYSGAESISTDGGGGLVASTDGSDWNSCYKNNLFDV
ncbi:hypothetical protein RIF29_21447 [Crotalaria pallida]|uniref:Uncharacterized protein n=1 Tax=Crotalaria pallida TaxID=3830 RepID=A0AAN9F310_CROPI